MSLFRSDVSFCPRILFFFFQAEDGIRDLVRSRGLGDVYKRQEYQEAVRRLEEEAARLTEHEARLEGMGLGAGELKLSLIHI